MGDRGRIGWRDIPRNISVIGTCIRYLKPAYPIRALYRPGLPIRVTHYRYRCTKPRIPAHVFKQSEIHRFLVKIHNLWAGKCTLMDVFGRQKSGVMGYYRRTRNRTPILGIDHSGPGHQVTGSSTNAIHRRRLPSMRGVKTSI